MQSDNIDQIAAALAAAQGTIETAKKDCENPFHKTKYCDLTSVWAACREQLSKNGLAVMQTVGDVGGALTLITTLAHSSGQWVRSHMPIYVGEKRTSQALGSALTYARRYSLAAMVGVAPEGADDDGQAATYPKESSKYSRRPMGDIMEPEPMPDAEAAPPPALVSHYQAKELERLFSACTEKHRNTVMKVLAEKYLITEFSNLPVDLFEKMKISAMKNIESQKNIPEQGAPS